MTIRVARQAVNSGLYPVFEMENGKIARVRKIKAEDRIGVETYLKSQKRFAHLFKSPDGLKQVEIIQRIADDNIDKYGSLD